MSYLGFLLALQIPGEKLLGLAKFFLAIGVPGDSKDLFYQINALSCLENNRQVIGFVTPLQSVISCINELPIFS